MGASAAATKGGQDDASPRKEWVRIVVGNLKGAGGMRLTRLPDRFSRLVPLVLMLGLLPATTASQLPPLLRLRGGNHDLIRGGSSFDVDDRPVDAAEDEPLISRASGRIELITGPMFSGKSTELLRRLSRFQAAKVPLVLLKFSGDDRYSTTEVQTHDRNAMSALAVSQLSEALHATTDVRVVGIDEGQFFEDLLPFAERLANEGKVVLIAALDGTFQRQPFGQIAEMFPLCERVDKLSAICAVCSRPASFTKRLSAEKELVSIGGADKYVAVCRRCFFDTPATPS